jgi:tetratricopeptide (TPR) repeat protein
MSRRSKRLRAAPTRFSPAKYSGKDLSWTHHNRGSAYYGKGDVDRAIADYSETIRLDPKSALAYNDRGGAYFDKGALDRAIADFNEAIKLDPKDADAYIGGCLAYSVKGDYDHAIAVCGELIKLDGKNAFAYRIRGIIYRYGNSLALAQADFKRSAELSPENAYAAL